LKIETTIRDDYQVRIVAEFEPEFMDKFKRQAARKISQDARIPGFRPGKAPYDVVRRMYGEEMIEKQAVELLLDEAYPQVLKEAAIEPSGMGNLEEIISYNPPTFSFIVPLVPKVELGDYKSVRKDYNLPVVGDSEIDQVLKNLRGNYSTAEEVERPIAEGDLVSLKISGHLTNPVEGEDAEVFKENTVQMIVGENDLEEDDWPYEGYTRELVGMSVNEEKTVVHTYPEDYVEEDLRGKEVTLPATVLTVKAFHMPEVTDEFAQSLGDFATADALRDAIRKNLEENNSREYNEAYYTQVFDEIIASSKILYPPQILQEEIESVLHSLEHDLEDRKMDLPTYLKTLDKEKETFIAEDIQPVAKRRLQRSLVINEIARAEEIKLDNIQLQQEVSQILQSFQSDPEFSKLRGERAQNFMQNLMMQTASQMLNRAVMSRVKAIASGQPETVTELIDETASVVEEPIAETTPVEAAVEPEAETAEGAAPTEEKPAEA
jgi:trigger factor